MMTKLVKSVFCVMTNCLAWQLPPTSQVQISDPIDNSDIAENNSDHHWDPSDKWEFLACPDRPDTMCKQKPTTDCTKYQKPSVLYIGLPHSGSSSMAWQMNMHPNLSYGIKKEHRYFSTFSFVHSPMSERPPYENEFWVDCTVKHTFDATPTTLWLSNKDARKECGGGYGACYEYPWHAPGREAIEKLKDFLGDIKFIVSIRDPMDMAAGHWTGKELQQHWRTCYADSLEVWLDVFPRKNFLFIDSYDYFADPQRSLDSVFEFLEVPSLKFSAQDLGAQGRRRASSPTSLERRQNFQSKPENIECVRRLEKLTGMKFEWIGMPED